MDKIINTKVTEICNGKDGYQPYIKVLGEEGCSYIITATPERKFKICKEEKNK